MLEAIRNAIFQVIKDTEFEQCSYFAGGCVRDEIIGRETNDIDITVELPEGGILLAEHLHQSLKTSRPVIYKQFGTALVIWKGYKLELVMTRKESYRAKSRKPDVMFGSLYEDVMRRDFTVNSLLMRISDGEILDLSGLGQADLNNKIVRATSEPEILFKEDPLRILRAIRFAITLDFAIEKNTLAALTRLAPTLKHISKERKAEEFQKIVSSNSFLTGLRLLQKTGVMKEILPQLIIPSQLSNMEPEDETYYTEMHRLSLIGRYTLMLWRHDDPTPLLAMLKLSQKEIEKVNRLTDCCRTIRFLQKKYPEIPVIEIRKKAFWYRDLLDEIVVLLPVTGLFQKQDYINYEDDMELCAKLMQEAALLDENRFNLTGDDLILTFCSENGSWVGKMLTQAREYWFEHPETGKAELILYLKELYQDTVIN